MSQRSPSGIRPFRSNDANASHHDESSFEFERIPFLSQEQSFLKCPDLEDGGDLDAPKLPSVSCTRVDSSDSLTSPLPSKWRLVRAVPVLKYLFSGPSRTVVHKEHVVERPPSHKSHRVTPLRRILRLLALALMLLGVLEFIALASGLFLSFFPDDADDEFDGWKLSDNTSRELGHWPTDFSADIHPVACHSHNDYWRKEPLFSALEAGCTGVEADVWLYDQELFVGHSTASLTPERTLRNLYINPLVKILNKQNPQTSFHPALDNPRNGVFDTKPAQTLVLLIDFKNEGSKIWTYVSEQLSPLRDRKLLSHFNGTSFVEGPVTVVATGNAPWDEVVANPNYRDIFFDAPLDLMGKLSDSADDHTTNKRWGANQGQGRSGAAPSTPNAYSPANSYYASVNFKSAVGWPWRGYLSRSQIETMRKQIAGAHAQGLKVRYWGVPSWPRGLRNYLWRTMVKNGADYLNVDDLKSATRGDWNWGKKPTWFSGPWKFWSMKSTVRLAK